MSSRKERATRKHLLAATFAAACARVSEPGLYAEQHAGPDAVGRCLVCGGRVERLNAGDVGTCWVHQVHPADGHDALPATATRRASTDM